MRGYFSVFILSFLFVSIAILSGYKSESSSTGCNSPPEIVVLKPSENDNIENPPVSVEFTAIQNSTDLTSIDLSKVTAIIRDNMNKTIYTFSETYENKVTFTGLPLNNNDFGVKRVYLDVRGFNYFYNMALDNIWVKIFFPKEAKNHPYPSGSQPNTPNWYFYWGQDVPAPSTLTRREYNPNSASANDEIGYWYPTLNGWTYIIIYDGCKSSRREGWTDYHACTAVMAHENKHEEDFRQVVWGGEPFDPNKDQDKNFLRDEWESDSNNFYIFAGCVDSYTRYNVCYKRWAETRAADIEENYPDKSSTNDWLSPGSNY